jgi:hypothetical protein
VRGSSTTVPASVKHGSMATHIRRRSRGDAEQSKQRRGLGPTGLAQFSSLGTKDAAVNGGEACPPCMGTKRSGSGILPNRWWSTTRYKRSQHTGDSSSSFTASRTSMAAEALRSWCRGPLWLLKVGDAGRSKGSALA